MIYICSHSQPADCHILISASNVELLVASGLASMDLSLLGSLLALGWAFSS
jgi:hypothetical protein